LLQKKRQLKKGKRNIENCADSKRFDELAKGFLAKATHTAPNKQQTVFVLIHQNSGFVNARHIIQEIRELGKANEGNGEHEICWNLNVKFLSMRWAANPEISMTLKQWHKSKYERGKKKTS
jgi:hypothetical protein